MKSVKSNTGNNGNTFSEDDDQDVNANDNYAKSRGNVTENQVDNLYEEDDDDDDDDDDDGDDLSDDGDDDNDNGGKNGDMWIWIMMGILFLSLAIASYFMLQTQHQHYKDQKMVLFGEDEAGPIGYYGLLDKMKVHSYSIDRLID